LLDGFDVNSDSFRDLLNDLITIQPAHFKVIVTCVDGALISKVVNIDCFPYYWSHKLSPVAFVLLK
jgi:hypothetical protein